jgi:hypothetical protein
MTASETITQIVALRRVREAVHEPGEQRRLAWVARRLRRQLGAGVPKLQAAAVLGVSVQSLDRYILLGKIPTLRRPGSSRELIDSAALLDLAEEVERQRENGERSPLARAIATLAEQGRLRRRLGPNQSAVELRREFLHTTSEARLRQGIELSELGASLGAAARARLRQNAMG